jgi:hypothetical protein
VGTIKPSSGRRLGQPLTGLDTPTLRGLWSTAPYLHDGSAATLLDVLTTQNSTGAHGATGALTAAQRDQLVAYLKQIDDDEPPAIPVPPSGLTATAGILQISLSWSAAPGAQSYLVKRSTVSGGPYTTIATNLASTSYNDGGLTGGVTYYYVVSAANSGGVSFNSSEASAVPGQWTVIAFDDFETGWGNYSSGGADASRNTSSANAHQGVASADIQDNSGAASSVSLTTSRNETAYTQLRVTFWYKAVNLKKNQDFFLEYSSNGGSTWQTAGTWKAGTDFSNNQWKQSTVLITKGTFSFTSTAKIRFRCDANGDGDDVYIDEIEFAGM